MLTFNDVTFSYPEAPPLLQNLSFHVRKGEFISIIGVSGSGKSTLFRLMNGLENPTDGTIDIEGLARNERLGNVGFMPQQDLLLPWRTVIDNASLPLELAGISKKEAHLKVKPLFERFGLQGTESAYPHQLSGGMRQRVSFLRATVSGNPLLLLDEPFSALDAITKLTMQEWLLLQWEQQQSTILFITHDVDEALFLSDRIFVVNQQPIHTLEVIEVPLLRPRTRAQMYDADVLHLKEQLLERLRKEVRL